ncbi:MAG: STAS domain-containing protein [Candidatus Latescibacteria bacterium]|nr:STAS domain-containing protein [Candidatus Latescibacterota bacterium]
MRIEVRSQTEGEVVLRVAGWADNPALVRVLREEVECWLEQGRRVVLDLEQLKAISPEGLALIHRWQGKPVELRRMPMLIASLVELLHGRQGLQVPPIRGLETTLQALPEAC